MRDTFHGQFLAAKMRAYDGSLFFCCSRSDRERILAFRKAARLLGLQAKEGKAVCTAIGPEELAKRSGRDALFVWPCMEDYLGRYLDACPAGQRHLLIYSRRKGNGPTPHNSVFRDFWYARGIDIWDLDTDGLTKYGSWWLLDVETSGLDREKDSIIALRLAKIENLETVEEQTILIRPERPLSPWAEALTGITSQDLEGAESLETALEQIDVLNQTGCFLLLDRGFTLPFLENAYDRCGMEFKLSCLPLDRLAEQLGLSGKKKVSRLLESLPPLPSSWPNVPPKDGELEKLYQLMLALFYQWEAEICIT